MFYLWYEYLSESYPRFNVFKIRDQHQLTSYTLHGDFSNIVEQSLEFKKYNHFFLLDESRFSFFRFDVFQEFTEVITIQDVNKLIQEKIDATKKHNAIDGQVVTTYIDTIFVDGEEKKFLIGQKGQIFFRLYVIYLAKQSLNILNGLYGDILQEPRVSLVPQSFYTLLFLRNNLKKDNFVLLYITENYCKAIDVKSGFYNKFEVLNLGMSSLKQMYKDNGVAQYWYKDYDFIEANPLAKGLVIETLEFYSELFCKWLNEKGLVGSNVIVISPITKNAHFIETFDKEYRKISNNYIIPFNHSEALDTFGKEREPEDMDSLVFMNQEKQIKNLLAGDKK